MQLRLPEEVEFGFAHSDKLVPCSAEVGSGESHQGFRCILQ